MLKLHSFKMNDDAGMNELLTKSRIAGGASVFVSNGEIIIPIEDGQPISLAHRVATLQELRNQKINLLDPITHTIKLSGRKIAELEKEIADLEALTKVGISHLESADRQLTLVTLNKTLHAERSKNLLDTSELARVKVEIEVYEEMIKELEG